LARRKRLRKWTGPSRASSCDDRASSLDEGCGPGVLSGRWWGRKLFVDVGGRRWTAGFARHEVRVFLEDVLELLVLEETADDVLHVQCKSFVRVPKRFGFQLQTPIIFAFALCRFEFFRERTRAGGVVHKIGLAKVSVESLLAK